MKRRELFKTISAFFGGILSAKSFEIMSTSRVKHPVISSYEAPNFQDDGSLLTLGSYPGLGKSVGYGSILTKVELSNSEVTRIHVPMHTGHYIDSLGEDEYLCIGYKSHTIVKILGRSLKIVQTQNITEGFASSGHCISDEKFVYLPVFSNSGYDEPDSKIEVLRKSDLSKVAVIDLNINTGIHDLAVRNDRLFALASSNEQRKGNFDYDSEKSFLIVVDIKDPSKPEITDYIKAPGNYTFSHIDINNKGNVIIGTVQRMDKGGLNSSDTNLQKVNEELRKMTDEKVFPITDREHLKNKFVLSTPFLVYNPKTGKLTEKFHHDRTKQRRLFTVKSIQNETYITCAYSDSILVIDENGQISHTLTSSDYGINIIRGIAPIQDGRKFIAFSDADLGISIVNANNYQLVKKFNIRLNVSSHLTYCPPA